MEGTVSTVPVFVCAAEAAPLRQRGNDAMLGKLINEHHLADELGLSVWALRKWRQRGYGPTPKKLGKRVMYVRAEVDAFLASAGGAG